MAHFSAGDAYIIQLPPEGEVGALVRILSRDGQAIRFRADIRTAWDGRTYHLPAMCTRIPEGTEERTGNERLTFYATIHGHRHRVSISALSTRRLGEGDAA